MGFYITDPKLLQYLTGSCSFSINFLLQNTQCLSISISLTESIYLSISKTRNKTHFIIPLPFCISKTPSCCTAKYQFFRKWRNHLLIHCNIALLRFAVGGLLIGFRKFNKV